MQQLSYIGIKNSKLIRELLDGDDRDFWMLLKEINLRYFKNFAHNYLIDSVSRLTIEMFSGSINEKEAHFQLDSIEMSNEIGYRIVDYDYMMKKRNMR